MQNYSLIIINRQCFYININFKKLSIGIKCIKKIEVSAKCIAHKTNQLINSALKISQCQILIYKQIIFQIKVSSFQGSQQKSKKMKVNIQQKMRIENHQNNFQQKKENRVVYNQFQDRILEQEQNKQMKMIKQKLKKLLAKLIYQLKINYQILINNNKFKLSLILLDIYLSKLLSKQSQQLLSIDILILEIQTQITSFSQKWKLILQSSQRYCQYNQQFISKQITQHLDDVVNRNIGKTTYKSLCNELVKETILALGKVHAMQLKTAKTQKQCEQTIRQKQQLIKKLKRELKYYQQHPSQDLYPSLKAVHQQNNNLKNQIKILTSLKLQNISTIEAYERANLLLLQQIQKLKKRIDSEQFQQILQKPDKITNNNSMINLKQNIEILTDMLDKTKIKVINTQQLYNKLQQYNENLINQRSILAKRASVGFQQLTPRPNVKKIFFQYNINYQKYCSKYLHHQNITTQNIMELLVAKIKDMEKYDQKIMKIQRQIKQKKQFQSIQYLNYQSTIDYINQTKNQIYRSIQGVEQVNKKIKKENNSKGKSDQNRNKK